MGAEGSGRRPIGPPRKGFKLSKFDGTEDSIKKRLGEIQDGIIKGQLDPRTGDTLISAEKAKLSAIRQEKSSTEIEKLRVMLCEAQEVQRTAKQIEARQRQHLVN